MIGGTAAARQSIGTAATSHFEPLIAKDNPKKDSIASPSALSKNTGAPVVPILPTNFQKDSLDAFDVASSVETTGRTQQGAPPSHPISPIDGLNHQKFHKSS